MYKFTVLCILMLMCVNMSNALAMSDFESSFLGGGMGSSTESPLKAKHTQSSHPKLKCGNNILDYSNALCNYGGESATIFDYDNVADESHSITNDTNTIKQLNNYATPDANQSSLRTTSSATQQTTPQGLLNNLSVPIQTGKNLNLNVSPQQIELNIKY